MPTSDCELITDGLLGQQVNTLTTIAFVIAGVVVARRPRLRWVGIALVATGVGSFVFHGPMPPGSQWAHDVSLDWLLLVVAGLGMQWEKWTRLPGFAAIGALLWLVPAAADPLAVLLTATAVFVHVARTRSRETATAMLSLGGLALFGRLGATNGPFCDPDSLLQPHGLWHLGAAGVVAWWVMAIESTALSNEESHPRR